MGELIDIGVNLTHDSFDADRGEVIDRAWHAGVRRMIVTGTTVQTSRDALALSRSAPGRLFATAGIHPHHASELDAASLGRLSELHLEPEVVAVGECGLDYFRNFSPPGAQRAAFEAQLELAKASQLPVFLHQRDAHEDFTEILQRHRGGLAAGVAHCFTGSRAELEACLALDLYIGITGWVCDERRGADLKAAVPGIPLDRLLLETDAPYLLPRSLRPRPKSRRNEPAYLRAVLEEVAGLRGEPPDAVAAATTANAERLFALPERAQ